MGKLQYRGAADRACSWRAVIKHPRDPYVSDGDDKVIYRPCHGQDLNQLLCTLILVRASLFIFLSLEIHRLGCSRKGAQITQGRSDEKLDPDNTLINIDADRATVFLAVISG